MIRIFHYYFHKKNLSDTNSDVLHDNEYVITKNRENDDIVSVIITDDGVFDKNFDEDSDEDYDEDYDEYAHINYDEYTCGNTYEDTYVVICLRKYI